MATAPILMFRWCCCGCDTTIREMKTIGKLVVCPKCRHLLCAGCRMLKDRGKGRPKKPKKKKK